MLLLHLLRCVLPSLAPALGGLPNDHCTQGFVWCFAQRTCVQNWSASCEAIEATTGVSSILLPASRVNQATSTSTSPLPHLVVGQPQLAQRRLLQVQYCSANGTCELSDLHDGTGLALQGDQLYDYSGYSVSSAGDINGDGLDDMMVGAYQADPNGQPDAGKTYIIFGSSNISVWGAGILDLTSLMDGQRGFVLQGDQGDYSGYSVSSAGDINGDGIDDMMVGTFGASPNGLSTAGKTYIIFGSSNASAWSAGIFNLTSLMDGQRGFVLQGDQQGEFSGRSVSSADDVNGDGIDDMMVGAYNADPNGRSNAGKTYIIFGSANISAWGAGALNLTSLMDGQRGFVLQGDLPSDLSGWSVSSAGDINGDGIDDMMVGAYGASPFGQPDAGKTYIIFGSANISAWGAGILDLTSLMDGQRGFVLQGDQQSDFSGSSVSSAGDINGDGIDDMMVGVHQADPNGRSNAGKTYIIFGSSNASAWGIGIFNLTSLMDGQRGFVLQGDQQGDFSGSSVSSAGDVNGDGLDDMMVGTFGARFGAGKTYIIFGSSNISAWGAGILSLTSLMNGQRGFVLQGDQPYDYSGWSVSSAGDINGDGISDMMVGAYQADSNGQSNAGKTYIIFGRNDFTPAPTIAPTIAPTLHPTKSPTPQHCERMLIQYCAITDGSMLTTVGTAGITQYLGVKPVAGAAGPFAVRAIRLEQRGDCIFLESYDWDKTYFGDYLSGTDLSAAATWRYDRYFVIDKDNSQNDWSVNFTGWSEPSQTLSGAGNFTFCVVAGNKLELAFDGVMFASLTMPQPAGSAYFIDMAIQSPSSNYRFPFDLMTFSETELNLPMLENKTTQMCALGKTEIGTLRNTGDCIHIDAATTGAFALGDYIGSPDAPSVYSASLCSNYRDKKALIWEPDLQTFFICSGYVQPPATGSPESYCTFYSLGDDAVLNPGILASISICKTGCGIELFLEGPNCRNFVDIPTDGDFVALAASHDMCNSYGPGAEGVFTSSCAFATTEQPTTVSPTTSRPTSRPNTRSPGTSKPTNTPTVAPTARPTSSPTLGPTRSPVSSTAPSKPSRVPTRQPTSRPSRVPTFRPTRRPTGVPTTRPTRRPTFEPTLRPTRTPTFAPTRKPTRTPTQRPTRRPTGEPTFKPTRVPTVVG